MTSERLQPRISVNKLGEYMVQPDSSRRRKILSDQKYFEASKPIAIQYSDARRAIVGALHNGTLDPARILRESTRLASDKSGTAKALSNRANDVAALDAFLSLLPSLPKGAVWSAAPRSPALMSFGGLSVSVAPEFFIQLNRGGTQAIGAVKLHFPKKEDRKLGKEGSQLVAIVLNQWLAAHGPKGRRIAHDLCLSVDVFRKTVYHAPKGQARLLARIDDSCTEILARWPTV